MFVWFTFRDSSTNPWRSGIETSTGSHKPSFSKFTALARSIAGAYQSVKAGTQPQVVLPVPLISYYSPTGTTVGVTYTGRNSKGAVVAAGEPQASVLPNQTVVIKPTFTVALKNTYTVTATVNDPSGHYESVVASLVAFK